MRSVAGGDALKQFAEDGGAFATRVAAMAVRRMDPQAARGWYRKLAYARSARSVGDPDAISWLMEFMNQLPLARVAGVASSMITGADMKYVDLDAMDRHGRAFRITRAKS